MAYLLLVIIVPLVAYTVWSVRRVSGAVVRRRPAPRLGQRPGQQRGRCPGPSRGRGDLPDHRCRRAVAGGPGRPGRRGGAPARDRHRPRALAPRDRRRGRALADGCGDPRPGLAVDSVGGHRRDARRSPGPGWAGGRAADLEPRSGSACGPGCSWSTGVAAVRISHAARRLPSLLLYLAIGLAIGEAGLGCEFEDTDLTQLLGTLALAVILAEGGFSPTGRSSGRSRRWPGCSPPSASVSVAVPRPHRLPGARRRPAYGDPAGGGASSTDAAAVFAVLRRLPIRARLRATVEAESGFNDPPVIILVTVVTSSAWDRRRRAGDRRADRLPARAGRPGRARWWPAPASGLLARTALPAVRASTRSRRSRSPSSRSPSPASSAAAR